MKKCDVCGNNVFYQKNVDEFFQVDGSAVLVESVPARICDRCGEATFDRETVEKVRRMVIEHSRPAHRIEVDAFAFG